MQRKVGFLAVMMLALTGLCSRGQAQEIQGRMLPDSAYRGGNIARMPGSTKGMSGSAGRTDSYTGVGVPTGASAVPRDGQGFSRSNRPTR